MEAVSAVPEAKIVRREDEGGAETYLFMQGPITLEVFKPASETDTDALLKSIDNIDKLPAGSWSELAILNELPCEPLDRKLLRPVFMGMIQLAWQRAFRGEPTPRIVENQVKRIEAYKRDLEHVKLAAASPAKAGSARTRRETTPRAVRAVRLTEDKAETWAKFSGQKGVITAAMTFAKACGPEGNGITLPVLAAGCRGKLNTKQPEERVIGFYFSAWIKEGVLEEVPEGTDLVQEVPAGWDVEPEPEPKAKKNAKVK